MRALRTLFVEDEDYVAKILEMTTGRANATLKDVHLEFHRADSKWQGIDRVNEIMPDICIVDINLPDGSGLDVIDYIRNHTHARVSVLSGEKMSALGTDAWRAGATAFLEKDNVPELSKQPDFLKEHLKEYLIALANEQVRILGQRFRVDLIGNVYRIGQLIYRVGSGQFVRPDGKIEKLGQYDATILNFFCKYPREALTHADLDRELGLVAPKSVKGKMDVIMSRFRSKVKPHLELKSEPGRGHRLLSPVELVPKETD